MTRIRRAFAARRWHDWLWAAIVAGAIAAPAGAAPPGNVLRVNPFIKPPLGRAAPSPEAPPPEEPTVTPTDLRFTLAAGDQSLVRVDGAVMRLGDELNGYRLESVGEGLAVFSHKGTLMTVRVHDDAAEAPQASGAPPVSR